MGETRRIILVEDNPADVALIQVALKQTGANVDLVSIQDGKEAIEYLSEHRTRNCGEANCSELLLLDLNLPRASGFEVLEFVKSDEKLNHLAVIILSGSNDNSEKTRCYAAGANGYFCKATDVEEIFGMVAEIIAHWAETVQAPTKLRPTS